MGEATFDYPNLTGRAPGRVIGIAGRVLPGVAAVQRQTGPFAAAWRAANLRTLAGTARRWVVLGDSMSLGLGAGGPFDGWVGQLHRRLDGAGGPLDVLNLAASGARVADLIETQIPVWRALPGAPAGEIVTVLVGSNDLLNAGHRAALPEAFATLLAMLPPDAVVASLPQPRRAARAANARIEAARAERGIRVVDLRASGPRSWRGRLAADHFHPNDAGYAALADAFEPPLRAALR